MNSEKPRKLLFYLINGLTVSRIILSIFVLILIFLGQRLTAFIIFLIGISTDLLDGDLARRFNLTSKLGVLLDGLADLFLIYSAIIPLFILNEFPFLIKKAIIIGTFLMIFFVLRHSLKNKKFSLPGRRASTTINSYFIYTTLAFFIINSPYKNLIAYLTCFVLIATAFDYFSFSKEK